MISKMEFKRQNLFATNLELSIPISCYAECKNLWYFKLRFFDLEEFIVWNILGSTTLGWKDFLSWNTYLFMSFVNLVNCYCSECLNCTVHNKNNMVVLWSSPTQILGKLVYQVHDQTLNRNKRIDRQTEYLEIPPELGSLDCVSMFFFVGLSIILNNFENV